ncbi:MAG: 3-deoxy-D-manno-octulosonic acid transferase [Thermoanaerobaculia bacterium]
MLLYRFLCAAALALYAPLALLQALLGRRRLGDLPGRLGRRPYPDLEGGIWIHAVSVGEVGVARNLIGELTRMAPGRRLGLSVTTAAGRELAQRTLPPEVAVFAFPFDLDGPVRRALEGVRPGLVLLTETELWPLFLDRARARGIPVALVNGRLSDRSFPRYRRVRRFLRRPLDAVALFAMQSPEDARRLEALGAPGKRIRVCGNIKYDLARAAPFADAARLARLAGGRPILVAASTAEGEEEIVLEAFARVAPRAVLAMAPRRLERFDAVASLIENAGFSVVRRSSPPSLEIQNPKSKIQNPPVYLLDSIGELASLYREALLAFVGGSLVPVGGHNPIEAWAEGVPVVVGQYTQNFREVTEQGRRRGLATRVADAAGLARAFEAALDDPERIEILGREASEFVAGNRGAARATAAAVLSLTGDAEPARAAAP